MTNPPNALKISYFQVFQPEPKMLNYGTPPSYLDNSHLGVVRSHIHNTVSNHMSAHLVLYSVQYHMLFPSIRNMFWHHKTIYIVHSQLPDVNSDSTTWKVMLPTVCLPGDARKITSPIPFTAFNCLGIPGDPYLPHYQFHLECYNCDHTPLLTPSLESCFTTHGITQPPSLSLLVKLCTI